MNYSGIANIISKIFSALSAVGIIIIGSNYAKSIDKTTGIILIVVGLLYILLNFCLVEMICKISDSMENVEQRINKLMFNQPTQNANQSENSARPSLSNISMSKDDWKCPNCGRLNAKTAMFCKDCGTSK